MHTSCLDFRRGMSKESFGIERVPQRSLVLSRSYLFVLAPGLWSEGNLNASFTFITELGAYMYDEPTTPLRRVNMAYASIFTNFRNPTISWEAFTSTRMCEHERCI